MFKSAAPAAEGLEIEGEIKFKELLTSRETESWIIMLCAIITLPFLVKHNESARCHWIKVNVFLYRLVAMLTLPLWPGLIWNEV